MGRSESVTEHLFPLIAIVSKSDSLINLLETCLCYHPFNSRLATLFVEIVNISAVLGIRTLPKCEPNVESIMSASALHARCESL